MTITLAFVNNGPGNGVIRARVGDARPVTVGRYDWGGGKWTARLYASPGKRPAIAHEVTATTVPLLRSRVGNRGKWWQ